MGKFLVTGAAGFIGSKLSEKLINDNNSVYTIDNLSTGCRKNLPLGINFIEGNCQDEKVYKELGNIKFDAIFHIAGQSSGEVSFENPVYDLQTNAQSTLLLLQYAKKTGCKDFIYASTMSVYGDKPDKPIAESSKLCPKSFYGVGKIASEHYMRIYSDFDINCTALRLFNVFGPGQNMKNLRQGMVSIFLAQAINDKQIHVKGSPERFRDFIFINDVVDAFLEAYKNPVKTNNVYNIGTGKRTTIKELIDKITENLPFRVNVIFKGNTPGDQFGIYSDIDKVRRNLSWYPKVDLEKGMKIFVEAALRK